MRTFASVCMRLIRTIGLILLYALLSGGSPRRMAEMLALSRLRGSLRNARPLNTSGRGAARPLL